MLRVFEYVNIGLSFVALVGAFRVRTLLSGKHVSRPLERMVGHFWTNAIRSGLIITCISLMLADFSVAASAGLAVYWLWLIDDVYFSDDDDEHKRWEGVKAKLKKCKPVMKRAAQRWKPDAPRVPVPA